MSAPSFIDSPFTTKVAYSAYLALPSAAERDAAWRAAEQSAGAAAPPPTGGTTGGGSGGSGGSGGGLLDEPDFFAREGGAPLLRRNAGLLLTSGGEPVPAGLRERLDRWPDLAGATASEALPAEGCEDEAALRIFLRDAERTFQDEAHRTRMIELLKRVWPENCDYHQGLGYVCSLLMLFFDEPTTLRMLLRLTRDEKYTPGYWKAAPQAYVRDAMVYARLVSERHPQVAALLQTACIVPEAYASKWFIGLCVHVLPYAALMEYVEAFLEEGHVFLFKFALALVGALAPKLLALQPTQVRARAPCRTPPPPSPPPSPPPWPHRAGPAAPAFGAFVRKHMPTPVGRGVASGRQVNTILELLRLDIAHFHDDYEVRHRIRHPPESGAALQSGTPGLPPYLPSPPSTRALVLLRPTGDAHLPATQPSRLARQGGAFFHTLVADAKAIELEATQVASLRQEEGGAHAGAPTPSPSATWPRHAGAPTPIPG